MLYLYTLLLYMYFIHISIGNEDNSYFGKSLDKDSCIGEHCKTINIQNSDLKEINIIITFTNAVGNTNLIKKFRITVNSLLNYTSVPLAIHIIGEKASQKLATEIINEENNNKLLSNKKPYRVSLIKKI